ncbi:MAG: 4Fe-4S dicluster domain-containing protein [Candidatus Omnitrophota bacterium]
MKYLAINELAILLENLKKDYRVFAPVKKGDQRFYKELNDWSDDIMIGEVRPFEPLKAFFTMAREVVAEDFSPEIPHSRDKPFAIVGVKNCDLRQGFKVQDHVFKDHDHVDPFYVKNREENLVIASDCTCTIDTCYCLAAGNQPYPQENFDLGLSPVKKGFVVETGSKRGQELIDKNPSLFIEAKPDMIRQRDEQRNRVMKEVENNIKENNVPSYDKFRKDIIERNWESDIWSDEAKTCVECGACTIICPTCHCFLLYDQQSEDKMTRLRIWDSCMIKDYARVAGGANPREKLWMRLRNRFDKKFDFFPKVADFHACTGCGRCITACPAKIDIRKVLRRLKDSDGEK